MHPKMERHSRSKSFLSVLELRSKEMKESSEGRLKWRDVLDYLKGRSDAELSQPVQVFEGESDLGKFVLLKPGVVLGTIEELCHVDGEIATETRGPDFAHHPEQVVLLIDGAPFSQDGDTCYTMDKDDKGRTVFVGNVTGKRKLIGEK